MATGTYPIQIDFGSGELSTALGWKIEPPEIYGNGVAALANYWVKPGGGVIRRPGTVFFTETKYLGKKVRLESFSFGEGVGTVFEIGHKYVRIHGDGSMVEIEWPYEEKEIDELYFAQFGPLIYVVHKNHPALRLERFEEGDYESEPVNFLDGPFLRSSDDLTWTIQEVEDEIILRSTHDAEFSDVDVDDYVEYERDGILYIGKVVSTEGPGNEVSVRPIENVVDVNKMEAGAFRQSTGDEFVYSVLAQFSERLVGSWIKISTTESSPAPATRWALLSAYRGISTVAASDFPDAHAGSASNIQLDLAESDDPIITSKWVTGRDGSPGYVGTVSVVERNTLTTLDANDEIPSSVVQGRLIRFNFGGLQMWGTVAAVVSDNTIQVMSDEGVPLNPENQREYANRGKSTNWRLGAFYEGNYPRTAIFHGQRLILGGTRDDPQTIWASVIGDFELFSPTERDSSVQDDNGFSYDISKKSQSPILWLQSNRVLLIGMSEGEAVVRGPTVNHTLTPAGVNALPETDFGSSKISPVRDGSSTFFVDTTGGRMLEYYYDFEIDSHIGLSINTINEDILNDGGGVKEMVATRYPWPMVMAVRKDGQLAAISRDGRGEFYPWHRTLIAGRVDFERSYASVESAAVEHREGDKDRVWLSVLRVDSQGRERRYIEYFSEIPDSRHPFDLREQTYVDSALRVRKKTEDISGDDNIDGSASHLVHLPAIEGHGIALTANGRVIHNGLDTSMSITSTGNLFSTDFLDQDEEETEIVLGINYTSLMMSMNPVLGTERGMSHVMLKRMTDFYVALHRSESVGIAYKIDPDSYEIDFDDLFMFNRYLESEDERDTEAPRKSATRLVRTDIGQHYERDIRMFVYEYRPIPQSVLAMGSRITVGAK